MGSFAGTFPFVLVHLALLIAWLLANSGKIPKGMAFRL
jgi:uncharacterized membrane protein